MSGHDPTPTASGQGTQAYDGNWRVGLTLASFLGLVGFVLLFLNFWAPAYSLPQDTGVVSVSILVFVGMNGAAWVGGAPHHPLPPSARA